MAEPTAVVPLPLRRARISSSHVLTFKQGVVLCWACGAYSAGGASPRLCMPCVRPEHGRQGRGPKHVLARWARGLTPRAVLAWPQELEGAEDRPPALLDFGSLPVEEPGGAPAVAARLLTPSGLCTGPSGARGD